MFMLNHKVGVWYKFIQYTLCGCMDYVLLMYIGVCWVYVYTNTLLVSVDYVLLMYTKRLYRLDTTYLSNRLTLNSQAIRKAN